MNALDSIAAPSDAFSCPEMPLEHWFCAIWQTIVNTTDVRNR